MINLKGVNLIYHTVGTGGGMERYVVDLITGLSRIGLHVRVVCQRVNWTGEPLLGVEFVVLSPKTPWARLNTWWFEKHALHLCKAEWPVISISRVPGVDIAIVGGTHLGHIQDRGKKYLGLFNSMTAKRERKMYAGATKVVAHSGKVAQEIIKLYSVEPKKVTTLFPPVDVATFSLTARLERAKLRQQLGILDEDLLLLFPSNNHVLKGAALILEALKGWGPRIRLVVAGKSPLKAEGVINLGYRNDMAQLYAAADAVILASRYEAFGMVGPESVLCGTPVLFAEGVGAAEVLSEWACLRFKRTVPALRAALTAVMNRHVAGTLQIEDPANHIHYPYSVDQHLAALLTCLAPVQ